jgi:hypothetical protein
LDLLAEWRLGDAEPGCRAAEMELLGHRDEVPEMPYLEPCGNHIKEVLIWCTNNIGHIDCPRLSYR